MNEISPLAFVDPSAVLGDGNVIGPFTVIGPNVALGDDNWIGSNVVLGTPPEHRAQHATSLSRNGTWLEIGSGNVIHEFTAIQLGTIEATVIGNDAFLMARTNIGHDCLIADGVSIAPNVILAGHVRIGKAATIGMMSCIHQRTFVGAYAMLGMGSHLSKDVPPFALMVSTQRGPVQLGLNEIAIQRNGLSGDWTSQDFLNDHVLDSSLPAPVREALAEWHSRGTPSSSH